jgi:hypothetical protein
MLSVLFGAIQTAGTVPVVCVSACLLAGAGRLSGPAQPLSRDCAGGGGRLSVTSH